MEPIDALIAWHGLSEEPRLVIGRNGGLLWTNAAARDFAKKNLTREANITDPELRWQEELDAGLFERVLAISVTCPAGKTRSLIHGKTSEEGSMIVKVIPLAGDSEAPIGVVIPLRKKLSSEHCLDLQVTFGLSGAELRVLRYLVGGETLAEAAKGLKTSIFTVRTHLRNIYQKLQVKSREAMFHLLSPLL
jgi:DNA-binding CsgD family transcriptional regulator